MKPVYGFLIILFVATIPAFAQDQQSANDIITEMQRELNLSQDQIYNITPIVEKYIESMQDLGQSVNDGTINQSAIDSQKQQLKAVEEQGLQEYLTANQMSQWHYEESQRSQQQGDKENSDDDPDSSVYSNLPRDIPSGN